MKVFYPVVHPIFRFPSLHHTEARSIKFIKNNKVDKNTNVKDERVEDDRQLRLQEHSFSSIDSQAAWWLFYYTK